MVTLRPVSQGSPSRTIPTPPHRKPWAKIALGIALALGFATPSLADDPASPSTPHPIQMRIRQRRYQQYRQVIDQTKAMVRDPIARRLASALELNVVNVTWEDTGRFFDSAVGPNISDLTIQVQQVDPATGRTQLHLMPVIRHPNFSDLTADVPIDQFYLRVGNERGEALRSVTLRELLGDLRSYLHNPDSWAGDLDSLLAPRDTHVLVSAQACFLPIPQRGLATFNPVLFNYQSYPENPAVLTIIATQEGTSITIIDNQRDGFSDGRLWGQRLFFNRNGERASFTGQRLSDFRPAPPSTPLEPGTRPAVDATGLNMVLLIQVPLKYELEDFPFVMAAPPVPLSAPDLSQRDRASNVEPAVISHGPVEGPFTEIDGLAIERDPDYPIRVTVQFYKATSNGVVTPGDMAAIRQEIDRVYADGDYVGSLVLDRPGDRPTAHAGPTQEPPDWWERFWQLQEQIYRELGGGS